jgi:hypothetical protein
MTTNLPVSVITQQLMKRTVDGHAIALPFTRDIFLLETHVAGIPHYQLGSVSAQVVVGAQLCLRREPSNIHDDLAIEVLTTDGIKIGYVPQRANTVLARLMDAGKLLRPKVTLADEEFGQMNVRIKIDLCDGYS